MKCFCKEVDGMGWMVFCFMLLVFDRWMLVGSGIFELICEIVIIFKLEGYEEIVE